MPGTTLGGPLSMLMVRWRRATGLAVAFVLLSLLMAGCRATVVPPPVPSAASRPVFLVDHGRTSSLLLTRADASVSRYVYGDWRWYALDETGVLQALPTLFVATPGALGRRDFRPPVDSEILARRLGVGRDAVHELRAPAAAIDELLAALDRRFARNAESKHYNAAVDLHFVRDPKPYYWNDNSNHVVADWLRQLGIAVEGNPMLGRWSIRREGAQQRRTDARALNIPMATHHQEQ